MASEEKKRKAKNSFLYNGGTRCDEKLKRILYYRKRDRVKIKRIKDSDFDQEMFDKAEVTG